MLIDELLVVGDEGLGNGLTDGVDLGGVTTTSDADADVDVGELVEADNQERLVDLETRNSLSIWFLGQFTAVTFQDKFCSHLRVEPLGIRI